MPESNSLIPAWLKELMGGNRNRIAQQNELCLPEKHHGHIKNSTDCSPGKENKFISPNNKANAKPGLFPTDFSTTGGAPPHQSRLCELTALGQRQPLLGGRLPAALGRAGLGVELVLGAGAEPRQPPAQRRAVGDAHVAHGAHLVRLVDCKGRAPRSEPQERGLSTPGREHSAGRGKEESWMSVSALPVPVLNGIYILRVHLPAAL